MNVPFFLPLTEKRRTRCFEPLGDVEVAVRTDGESGRSLELAVDHSRAP